MESIIREVQNAKAELLAGRQEEVFTMLQNIESELIRREIKND